MMQCSAPCCVTWDMGCDRLHNRLYDHLDPTEDFFRSMALSEDVWDKFELMPSFGSEQGDTGQGEVLDGRTSTMGVFASLGSMIIQDCMWSGLSNGQGACDPLHLGTLVGPQTTHSSPQELQSPETECVNPAAVLTIPFNHSSRKAMSSDDEEEIDVVTVESKQSGVRVLGGRKPVTITLRADPLDPGDPCMKHFHISVHRQQHNYAAPFPDDPQSSPGPCSPAPQSCLSPLDTPQSSDNEEAERCGSHDFLDRQRRGDLRRRYVALRDEIPGLAMRPRTPKVLILTEALQYLQRLRAALRLQAQERKQLRSRQRQLLRKLVQLQRT